MEREKDWGSKRI